jgi:hypothetical protein
MRGPVKLTLKMTTMEAVYDLVSTRNSQRRAAASICSLDQLKRDCSHSDMLLLFGAKAVRG